MGIKLSCFYGKMLSTSVAVDRLSKPDYIAVRVLCLTEMTSLTDQLDNGPVPADSEKVFFFLEKHGLSSTTRDHPPMFTVTDSQALRPSGVSGGYTKNFFLRNKKKTMWLVTCDENQSVDLRHLGTALGAGRLSFASSERLMRFLGITTGAVSPLALINDVTHKVHFAIDRSLLRHDQLHVHPLVNTLTTTLPTIGLVQFAIKTGHPPDYLTFHHDGSVTIDTSSNKMLDGRLKAT